MNALAGLMNPAAIGQGVASAFEQGRAQAKQRATDNALSQYAMNPSAETAAGVAPYDPRLGIQLGQHEQQRSQQAEEARQKAMTRELAGRAAQGDKRALVGLWGVDWETASKLDKYQTDKALEGFEFIAGAAYQIIQLPEEQRAQAWDAYIQQGVQLGFDGLAQYQGQYDPMKLNAFVTKAGEMKEFQTFQQPKYTPVGEGGLSGFQYGKPIMQGGQAQDFGNVPPPPPGFQIDGGAAPAGAPPFGVNGNRLDHITMMAESGGNPNAVSPKGARGLMQVMPATARDPGFGIRPSDGSKADDVRVGKEYRRAMQQRYNGDPAKMWAAYNAGPGRVDDAINRHGDRWLNAMPAETRNYVAQNVRAMRGR